MKISEIIRYEKMKRENKKLRIAESELIKLAKNEKLTDEQFKSLTSSFIIVTEKHMKNQLSMELMK